MELIVGDVFDVLPTIPDESVRTCVTSPPYWGLRDYGTADWDGGDPECDHVDPAASRTSNKTADEHREEKAADLFGRQFRGTCETCGATRVDQQVGIEESPEAYVERLVEVFREVRRVLTDDGTLWLNLGDGYAGSWGAQGRSGSMADRSVVSARQIEAHPKKSSRTGSIPSESGLKPKDLVGIPWRVAFALQADGWWLRSDIIWSKPNPMPESVTDRPTKAHEYIFLLSKAARYYYDHEAIAERAINAGRTVAYDGTQKNCGTIGDPKFATRITSDRTVGERRNRRSVWTIATKPFPEAHFAVFPLTLPMLCIQAGTAIGDTVLDPFAGAGTTGVAAQKLGREFVGVELNPEYAAMAERRIAGTPLSLFAEVGE